MNNFKKYNTLLGQITFESLSFLGRKIYWRRNKLSIKRNTILLDLGSGNNYKEGWINADFFHFPFIKLLKRFNNYKYPDFELDLRYPIRSESCSIDGVFSCHTLEHLYPDEAFNLLKEVYRILKPCSWLRICIPDLELAVEFYNGNNTLYQFDTGCEAISDMCQNWGHKSAWDRELLTKCLDDVGFEKITKTEYGKTGTDKRLIIEDDSRKNVSLVIEAMKPN